METLEALNILEKSFLAPFLEERVTDISYDGKRFYLLKQGVQRQVLDLEVSRKEVELFLYRLANSLGVSLSFQSPVIDVSFGRYRLNALHHSIGRNKGEKTYLFSLRIASCDSILDKDKDFFCPGAKELLLELIEHNQSIIIGGVSGSGKTELEKWLLGKMKDLKRVIIIDHSDELSLIENEELDLNIWVAGRKPFNDVSVLIANALRANPDYLVFGECRAAETYEVLVSATSGHPLITSIHALKSELIPLRLLFLTKLYHPNVDEDSLMKDIRAHFPYFVYLKRESTQNGEHRYLESIARLNEKGEYETLIRRDE